MTRKLIAIVGATATGKTALAVELARKIRARSSLRLRSGQAFDTSGRAEVVGADSRQVYRYMDIGTAKPTAEERAAVPHHLVDVVKPDEPFSLGDWLDRAPEALADIWARGGLPMVVGGTGQYVWALLEGWRVPRVPADRALRDELASRPAEELAAELRRVDPEAGAYIDPRNVRRVIRALEVQTATGRPFSYWRTKQAPEFEPVIIGLSLSRQELYSRVDARVEAMFEAGLVEEVRGLLEAGNSRDLPSMSGIGYKEAADYLAGECSLEEAIERTKTGTHRLTRHQNSWFKWSDERIHWLPADERAVDEAWRLVAEGVEAPEPLR